MSGAVPPVVFLSDEPYDVAETYVAVAAALEYIGDCELCDEAGNALCGEAEDAVWIGTRHIEVLLIALRQAGLPGPRPHGDSDG